MSEATQGQDPNNSGQAPQNTPPPPAGTQDPAAGGQQAENPEIERLKRELAATRNEAAGHRVKLKEYEQANQTELERAQAAAKEAQDKLTAQEARAKETSVRLEVERAARRLGIVDEDAAFRLLDMNSVTLGDDGAVSGVDAALGALLQVKPWLKGGPASAGNPANPPAAGRGDAGTFTREQLNDPVFYAANRDAIFKAMREGRIQ